MKIETLWIVLTPQSVDSEMADIFFSATMAILALQFRGGLDPRQIAGMYTERDEAQNHAARLLHAVAE